MQEIGSIYILVVDQHKGRLFQQKNTSNTLFISILKTLILRNISYCLNFLEEKTFILRIRMLMSIKPRMCKNMRFTEMKREHTF